jgi:hypothetical protein
VEYIYYAKGRIVYMMLKETWIIQDFIESLIRFIPEWSWSNKRKPESKNMTHAVKAVSKEGNGK